MKNIGGFFEKFNSRATRQIQNYMILIEVIKKHTGITLEPKQLLISNGIVRVKGTSLQKNEIFIKKSRILKELEGRLQALIVTDIQ